MEKVRFGIIGCGRISYKHLEVINSLENSELAAVCDIQAERMKEKSGKYKVPGYTDYNEMLKNENIDAVNILTPSGTHAGIGIDIASKYKAHLIIEKPMSLRLDEADELIKKCSGKNLKLFVVQQNRYNLPVIKLKETIKSGRFGKIVLATVRIRWCRPQAYYDQDEWRGTWKMDGGVLTNQASHHIDLLQWLVGPVKSVMAKTATALNNIEVEDTGAAVFEFENGALGIVEATTCARPKDLEGSLSILGENGTVEIGGFAVNKIKTWKFNNETEEDKIIVEKYSENPPNVYGFGHLEYLKNVADCIINNTEIPVDGIEGRKSLELINAIYESVETHNNVPIRFQPQKCKLGI